MVSFGSRTRSARAKGFSQKKRLLNESPIETLEMRRLLSTSAIRVVAYNIEDDISGNTTPLPGLYQVLEGIGEEQVQGNVRPIDILGLEETTSNADVQPIVTALNSYYGSADVYAESSYQGTQDGSNDDGNGPNALVYNSSTLNLVQSVGVGTPEGSTNGVYRQPIRYEFQPAADTGTSTGIFYVYVLHTKSGTTSADATDRGEEAAIVRSDEATLPSTASVIYMGDLNSNPPEAEFTNFEASGQGEAYDPFSYPSSPTRVQQSDASTGLSYRDDYELMTSNVYSGTGAINYVSGSFHNFGNNGSVSDPASSSNTALNSDLVTDGGTFVPASTIYTDLGTASDHLPVVADYTISGATTGTPTIGTFAANPSSVTTGTPTTLTASSVAETGGSGSITGVNFYLESNGTNGLQIGSDTLVGAGTQSGTTWTVSVSTTGLATGSYTYYAVATDSNGNTSTVSSATLTVNAAAGTPTIGAFVANPSSVVTGTSTTLTASSVTETGGSGSITGVNFYCETNGTTGLQIGSDTLIGAGTQSGTTWTISAPTTGFATGSYTYYAVATDSNSNTSAVSSTTLTVTSASTGTPTVSALTIGPSAVSVGGTTTLTASNVFETDGTISSVAFYRESNGTTGLQTGTGGDTLVGSGTETGNSWTLSNISTTGLAAGTYTYYAIATDSSSNTSAAASAILTITAASASGTLVGFNTSTLTGGSNNFGPSPFTPDTVASNITAVGLTRGSGIGTTGTGAEYAWGGSAFSTSATTESAAITAGDYATLSITGGANYAVSLSQIPSYNIRRSGSGPSTGIWQYEVGGGSFTDIGSAITWGSVTTYAGNTEPAITLSSIPALQNVAAGTTVTLRVVDWDATSASGTWYINYPGSSPSTTDTFTVTGSVAPASPPTAAFSASSYTVNESAGTATITVNRTGTTTGSSTVQYLTSDNTAVAGTDYTSTTGTLTFAANVTSQTFTIPVTNIATTAGTRSLNIALFNPSTGSQTGTQATATLTITDNAVIPAWLASNSVASWNPSTKTLTVTGAATIISDPGSDEPKIVDSTAGSVLTIAPTTADVDVHVGGITLSNGAQIVMTSVDASSVAAGTNASNHSTDHNVLVLGTEGNAVAPTLSVDSLSKLDLTDNDLIVHSAASDDADGSGTSTELGIVQALAATGRNVAPGGVYNGTWTGNGLTSSAAATADSGTYAGDEQNVLAVGLNSDLFVENYLNSSGTVIGSGYNKWTVGSASENLAMNDIIVKYTYNGDLNLDGKVDSNASLIFSSFYDDGASTQNDYVFGDLNGDGKVDNTDSLIFSTFFGNGDQTYNDGYDGNGNGLPQL